MATIGIFLFFVAGGSFAQDSQSVALSYQRNFVRSGLDVKLDILKEAEEAKIAGLGPLYELALDFALQNAELLRDDPALIALATDAARGIGATDHTRAVSTLWRVFMAFRDSRTRVAVLGSLATLGKGDGQVVENLNQNLANQNNVYRAGIAPDEETLSACIAALAALGDGSSFPVLFSAMIAGYPPRIANQASEALKSIRGDYKKYLIDVMRKNPPAEKLLAFKAGAANDGFNAAARGELAEAALEITLGLYPTDPGELEAVQELRYSAILELTVQRWTRAVSLAIKHFYRVQTDYGKGLAPKGRFIEAVACLGSMASGESAQALSLQLGLLNAEMEQTRNFDADILFAVIDALGEIGDKVAFDYLLYIGYLPYPDDVKAAAREALNRLKW
jgi:hypothetical protein